MIRERGTLTQEVAARRPTDSERIVRARRRPLQDALDHGVVCDAIGADVLGYLPRRDRDVEIPVLDRLEVVQQGCPQRRCPSILLEPHCRRTAAAVGFKSRTTAAAAVRRAERSSSLA